MNLKEKITEEILAGGGFLPLITTRNILNLFNRWLREQDARNPDGDELRLDEIPPRTYHWVGRGTPDGGLIWRLERMRINKGVQTPPERTEAKP